MSRTISVTELLTKRRNIMEFEGAWKRAMGCPELKGSILVWGESGNGKTRFVLQFCKYLTRFERVLINNFEEGDSETMKHAFIEVGMEEVNNRIAFVDSEPFDEMVARLEKRKSPNVILIDSVQHSGITLDQYQTLKRQFPNKLFIYVSHNKGKHPDGAVANKIRFDSNVKIWVEGFRAICRSRYGSEEPYTIWEEGAAKYWMDNVTEE